MRRRAATVAGLALILLSHPLIAQDTPPIADQEPAARAQPRAATPEFRRGQWGGEFMLDASAFGIGALRFSSPDDAWSYFGTFAVTHEDNGPETNGYGVGLQVGRRTYGAPRGRVRAFRQLGIGLSFGHSTTDAGGIESSQTGYSVGVHALLGGTVFVAQDLSIGAEWLATGNYFHQSTESDLGPDTSNSGWTFDVGEIRLTGAFYF